MGRGSDGYGVGKERAKLAERVSGRRMSRINMMETVDAVVD